MGTTVSANDEWIELYNDGGDELVDGWVLSDGMNLTVTLTGTIAANSYAVLERTDDTTVAGSAFMIYVGSLVNTGATLTLKRSDGSLADQVAGGADWSAIGGDNVTKETAQYSSSGWVTAVPTPGGPNSTISQTPEDDEDDAVAKPAATKSSGGGGGGAVRSRPAEPVTLHAEPSEPTVRIFMPATLYVNQEVTATAIVSTVGKTIAQSMEYQWNFGDIATGTGKAASHRYAYPGEYIVSVQAAYKDFVATDKVAVTVLPLVLSMTHNAAGDLQIHNDAKYEIDASSYTVRGTETVTFPAHTYIAPSATITIPRRALGAVNAAVVLKDSIGQTVAYYNPRSPSGNADSMQPAAKPAASLTSARAVPIEYTSSSDFSFGTESSSTELVPEATPIDQFAAFATNTVLIQPNPLLGAAKAGSPLSSEPLYPYVGLAAVVGVALLAAVAGRPGNKLPRAAEFDQAESASTDALPFR